MNWKYQILVWIGLLLIFTVDVLMFLTLASFAALGIKLILFFVIAIQFVALFLIAMAAMYN